MLTTMNLHQVDKLDIGSIKKLDSGSGEFFTRQIVITQTDGSEMRISLFLQSQDSGKLEI